jgi:hypothetical protein
MKKILFISLILSGCTFTKESKAKKLINEELKMTLNDYKSYEPMKFGNLDTLYTSFYESPSYRKDSSLYSDFFTLSLRLHDAARAAIGNNNFDTILHASKKYEDSAMFFLDKEKDDSIKYIPFFKGWKMEHSFRAKNAFGALIIQHYLFSFDKNLDSIIYIKNISE